MHNQSPATVTKKLEAEIHQSLRKFDVRRLPIRQRRTVDNLMQNLSDSQIYTRAYELSEMPEEQQKNAKLARKWLHQARKNILSASEFELFNPVDVAHLTAYIDVTIEELK